MLPTFARGQRDSNINKRVVVIALILFTLFGVFQLGQIIERNQTRQLAKRRALEFESSVPSQSQNLQDPASPWIETISWRPRIFLYHNFLSQAECDHILDLAGDDVERSGVVGEGGKTVISDYRTSNGVFLGAKYMMRSKLLRDIERRIADWTLLPTDGGELFYLIRYEEGQQYKAHTDYFHNGLEGSAGNRIATVLMYIGAPEEGGETLFPEIGVKVQAKKGDAVLFWDFTPDFQPDPLTLHAALPVLKGTKWAMTKWIRPRKTHRWTDGLSAAQQNELDMEEREWLKRRRL